MPVPCAYRVNQSTANDTGEPASVHTRNVGNRKLHRALTREHNSRRQVFSDCSVSQKRPGIVGKCVESDRQEEVAGPDVNAAESEAHQELKDQ
jgi:hypothetical protein